MIIRYFFAVLIFALSLTPHAQAQDNAAIDVIPAKSVSPESEEAEIGATHPAIQITPDKSEIVSLDQDAFTIVVGNPAHLNVLADSARRLVLVPQAPGATHFTVLGENGNVIMQRHVIVASPKKNYVRVRRSCAAGADGCASTSVYYCPDMCHEIALPVSAETGESAGGGAAEGIEEIDPEANAELTGGVEPIDE